MALRPHHRVVLDLLSALEPDTDAVIGRERRHVGHALLGHRALHLAHRLDDVVAPHEPVIKLLQSDFARDQRRGHGKLDRELRFQCSLRLAVAQHQVLRIADTHIDFVHSIRIEIMLSRKIEHRVDRTMRRVAHRIALDVDAHLLEAPVAAQSPVAARHRRIPRLRVRMHEPGAVLENIGRCCEPAFRQPCREHARLRRAPRMQRFGHGTEIGDGTGRQRGRNRDGVGGLFRIEMIEPRAGRRRR